MIKIGFIDFYLDEWHANNYPKWIQEQSELLGIPFKVAYAWEDHAREGGLSGKEWCAKFGVELLESREAVCEKSDVIVVLSPDNAEEHERLGREALMSGQAPSIWTRPSPPTSHLPCACLSWPKPTAPACAPPARCAAAAVWTMCAVTKAFSISPSPAPAVWTITPCISWK